MAAGEMTFRRDFDAPPDRVYATLLDPEAVASWRVPEGMSARVHTFELVPNERVVEELEFESGDPSLGGPMRIAITLRERDGKTEMTATHSGLPAGVPPADNELGWQMSLAKLAALVEG